MSVCTGVSICTCFKHWADKVKLNRGSGSLRIHQKTHRLLGLDQHPAPCKPVEVGWGRRKSHLPGTSITWERPRVATLT